MIRKISEKITAGLESTCKIRTEDKALYEIGIRQGITALLNFISAFLIGLIFHNLLEVMVFSVVFIPLRQYSGGYHAKSPRTCYFASVSILVFFCIAMKYCPSVNSIWLLFAFLCSIIILSMSPVEAINKPLEKIEEDVYRKRTFLIWILEIIALAIFLILKSRMAMCIIYVWIIQTLLLLIGKYVCKNHRGV